MQSLMLITTVALSLGSTFALPNPGDHHPNEQANEYAVTISINKHDESGLSAPPKGPACYKGLPCTIDADCNEQSPYCWCDRFVSTPSV